MSNVLSLKKDTLADLANKINVCAAKSDDYRVTASIHLAEAKALCIRDGITFKEWVRDNIKFSYGEAHKLAKAGASDNPAKAIADMRKAVAARVKRHTLKVALANTTDDDDDEEEEIAAPGQLPNSVRIRGLLHRSKEAKDMAEADDLSGIPATSAMIKAVSDAARAWIELLSKLEGKDNG